MKSQMERLRLLCIAGLLILLTSLLASCSTFAQIPPDQAIKLAIAQQLTKTQQTIAQNLGIETEASLTPNFQINQLTVQSREKLPADSFQRQDIPGDIYRVRGTFEAALTAPLSNAPQQVQPRSPFDIYLSAAPADSDNSDPENPKNTVETWYLIKPIPAS